MTNEPTAPNGPATVLRSSSSETILAARQALDAAGIAHEVGEEAIGEYLGPMKIDEIGRAFVVLVAPEKAQSAIAALAPLKLEEEADLELLQTHSPQRWASKAGKIYGWAIALIAFATLIYMLLDQYNLL